MTLRFFVINEKLEISKLLTNEKDRQFARINQKKSEKQTMFNKYKFLQ